MGSLAFLQRDLAFVNLDREAFESATPISIDYAVMEKTTRAAVIPVSFGWSDVGSWHAVWELSEKDAQGNAARGPAVFDNSHNCNVASDGAVVALEGVDDLVVASTQDAVADVETAHVTLETRAVEYGDPDADGHTRVAVRLTVSDNGPGFPARILTRAFEPYVTTKAKGTGLGLAMVKKIVDEHGARIDIRNRLKAGDVIEGAQISILFLQLADNAATQGPGERAGRAAAEQGTKATAATVQTRAA